MRAVKQVSTGKIVYVQEPEFEPGKGIASAGILSKISEKDLQEVEATQEEIDSRPEKIIAEQTAIQKTADIQAALPSWSAVEGTVNNISSLAEAKAFLLELSRVVYWLAKNSPK